MTEKTFRVDNANNQQLNDDLLENIDENLKRVATSLTDNEKDQKTNNYIPTGPYWSPTWT